MVQIVTPTAHWGHRKPAKTSMYLWFIQWLLRLTGDPDLIKWRDLHDVMYSGSCSSLRTQNDRNDLDLQVVHIVALGLSGDQEGLQWLNLHAFHV